MGEKTKGTNCLCEAVPGFRVQVNAPASTNERRCSTSKEPSDDTGKNVAGSRGGETNIPFAANYLLV